MHLLFKLDRLNADITNCVKLYEKSSFILILFLSQLLLLGCQSEYGFEDTKVQVKLSSTAEQLNEGQSVQFQITLAKAQDQDIKITLQYSGNFLEGTDLSGAPSSVVIPKGNLAAEISFLTLADGIYQSRNRILAVTISGSEVSTSSIEFLVKNQDPFPTLSGSSSAASEGSTSVLNLTLDRAADVDLSFNYTMSPGTALASDYTGSSGVIKFTAGTTTQSLTTSLNTNALCESPKTFLTQLTSTSSASTQGSVSFVSSITEGSPMNYTLNNNSVNEGSVGNLTLTSAVSCPFNRTISVKTTAGTAVDGVNYTGFTSANVTLLSGNTTVSVPVTTLDDLQNGPDLTLSVSLVDEPSVVGTLTVVDTTPPPTLSWTVASQSISEGVGTASISWQLNSASARAISATVGFAGTATDGTDYTYSQTTISIPAGTTSGSFAVQVTDDNLYEGNETLILSFASLTNATAGTNPTNTVTITENDSLPQISVTGSASVLESQSANFLITLNRASVFNVDVNYSTSNGSATAGTDYTSVSGSVTFAPGETSKTVTVATSNNATVCEANKNFSLDISSPSGGTLGTSTYSMPLWDNDNPSITVNNVTVTEGTAGTFTATLSQSCNYNVSFTWQTQNNTATAGQDFTSATATATITAGSTTVNFSVATIDDVIDQGSRIANVIFSSGNRATVPASASTLTINDNDTAPTLSFSKSTDSVLETAGTATVNVVLSHITNRTVTATITTSGTATINQDYTLPTTAISIPAGSSSQTVSLSPTRDTTSDSGETVILTLGSVSGATLGATSVYTLTLEDDPNMGSLLVSSSDSTKLVYASSLSGGTANPLSVGGPLSSAGAILSRAATDTPQVGGFHLTGDQSLIIFSGNNQRVSGLDLFSVNFNGTGLTRLNASGWAATRKVQKFRAVGTGTKIIFLADQASLNGAYEMYAVNANGSSLISLGSALSGGKTIADFEATSDGNKIVFLSDLGTLGTMELYSIDSAGTSQVKLNANLSAGQDVDLFAITPDNSKVVYAVKGSGGDAVLYVVPIGGGSSTQLSRTISNRIVKSFKISLDSSKVAYVHNDNASSNFDLYVVGINGSSRTQVNQNLISGGAVTSYDFSPNSSKILYLGEAQNVGSAELYTVSTDGTNRYKLNNTLVSGGRIDQASFTPDGANVIYLGHQDSAATQELYAVSLIGTGRVKLNLTPVSGGQITQFAITSDSTKVIYMGDQNTSGIVELFSVNPTGLSRATLNSSLASGKKVDSFKILPNNSRVLYRANQDDVSRYDWYSVKLDGTGGLKTFSP